MLVSSSELDNFSLDDSESEIIVPRPDDEDNYNDDDDDDDDDDWGIVSVHGNSEIGEVIVDGIETTQDDEEKEDTKPELRKEPKAPDEEEASHLSVPTIVEDMDDLLDIPSKVPTNVVDAQVQTTETSTIPNNINSNNNQNHSNRLVLLLVVPALLMVPTIASVYLYKERSNLQTSLIELEDTVSHLHVEAEQRKLEEELLWEDKEFLQLSSRELQEKVLVLKKQVDGKKIELEQQVDHLHKERSSLKLYIAHLQDKVDNLKRKAAKEKREGDVLFQDKKFLEWSAASLQEKVQKLKLEAAQKEQKEQNRVDALQQEKMALELQLKQFQDEMVRLKQEADRKLREEELKWNTLFQEKISLRVATANLEEQIAILKKKAKITRHQEAPRRAWYRKERDVLLDTVAKLEDEVLALREEAERRKKTEDILNLNSCGAEGGDFVLFDNCWINARLGNCANDAKTVVEGAIHDLSESFSHWMESYAASAKKYSAGSHSQNSTPRTKSTNVRSIRKMAALGKKLENSSTIHKVGGNATSGEEQSDSIGTSVAKMMRSVDSFGRALWNATAFRMHRHGNVSSRYNQGRSFFSRMDLNGKLWFESFFPASANRKAFSLYRNTTNSLDRVFQKVSDIILAASHPDEVLEQASAILLASSQNSSTDATETFMTSAMTKFCNSVASNRSSKKSLMKAVKQSYKEISLYYPQSVSM